AHAGGAMTASGNAKVILPGGLHVDSDSASALVASGNAQVNVGNAVLVVGGVSKSGNAQVTKTGTPPFTSNPLAGLGSPSPSSLTAPSSGPYAGVALFQSHSNSRALSMGGNGVSGITGTVYAPAAAVGLSGNAQLTGSLVASTLSVTGDAGAFQLASGGNS